MSRGFYRLLLLSLTLLIAGPAAAREPFEFAYLYRDGDPVYEETRSYTGLRLRDKQRPLAGAEAGLKESKVLGRAIGLKFKLRNVALAPDSAARDLIDTLLAEGVFVILLDLPLDEVRSLGQDFANKPVMLFNIRHRDASLRGVDCSPALFHTLPSHAMLMDALGQFLNKKGWDEVLLLKGEEPGDEVLAEAFRAAAAKFGLQIEEERDFVLSNDPRQRSQNNIALLTAGVDHDVIFLADSLGEVGRYVPFNSAEPRPVVGSEGLKSSAWHWTWERHGAPQLNQRFNKRAKRRMQSEDWAAWAAIRVVVEALTRSGARDAAGLGAFLRGDDLTFDTYKGEPGSFRPWNNQLRQAILLHSHNAVVARAPLDGFLHQHFVLDSIGVDRPQSACSFE